MSSPQRTVAIIGASNDRSKYGNKALRAFRDEGWEVIPINPGLSEVEGIPAYPDLPSVPREHLNRVSFYVPPAVGLRILEAVATKQVDEVWLNPGSDSEEVIARAEELGLNVIQACSIVDIGRSPSRY